MTKNKLVEYEIQQTYPGIFAVRVKDQYQRAMLFVRYQEHYESPIEEIRGKHFDLFEFMEIYRKWAKKKLFNYPSDWVGYNVPGKILESCSKHVLDPSTDVTPTPYDHIMADIIREIKGQIKGNRKYYVLGVDTFDSTIMDHEICHGLYYVDPKYAKGVKELIATIPQKVYSEMKEALIELGYCEDVIDDEMQAFLSTGLTKEMSKIRGVKKEALKFKNHFKKYKK